MTKSAIMDLIAAVVLLSFCLYGVKRGLFRAIAGLLSAILALVGGNVLAGLLTEPAMKFLSPLIETQIESKMEAVMTAQSGRMPEIEDVLGVMELLERLGIDEELQASLAERAVDIVRETGVSVVTAVAKGVTRSFVHSVLHFLSFIVLTVLLKFLVGTFGQLFKLPVLHTLDAAGGGLVGILEGMLLLFLAVWMLRRLGVSFDTEAVAATYLFQFFTTHTPLSALSFLQGQ